MRNFLTAAVLLILSSCLSETSVKPGPTPTFIRYYSGGNNDAAQAFEETPDKGFIILANTKIQKAEADTAHFKIKLIRTDLNGNPIWTQLFPAANDKSKDYVGTGLQLLPSGGYVVTGDDIQKDGTTKSLLLTVGDDGKALTTPHSYGTTVRGKAVAVNSKGNYLILSTSGTETMYLAEIDKTTFLPADPNAASVTYAAGATTLANKLFIDETGKALWSGVVTKNGLTGIRMIKTTPNNVNTDFDLLISQPGFSEVATDFCRFGFGYAVTGSTNKKGNAVGSDTDILFKRLAPDGQVLSSQSFPFGDGTTADGQNDVGNSISSTQDGGLILLSSVSSVAIKGRGDTDYYLIKINAFGDKDTSFGIAGGATFGSKFKDDGVAVRQASDGGYVVLGTITEGALKMVTLTKTDKQGKIQ